MADIAKQISDAKQQGYSDDDIVGYLGTSHPELALKIKEAQTHGYGAADIVAHLGSAAAPAAEPPSALSRFGKGLYDSTIGGLVNTIKHPIDTAKSVLGIDELEQIAEQVKAKNYGLASALALKHVAGGVNKFGQGMVDPVVEDVKTGNYAGAAGRVLGTAGSLAAPELLEGKQIPLPKLAPRNPVTAGAMEWAQNEHLPIPAGPATDNAFIKVLQRGTENTPLGSLVTDAARQKLSDAMASKGRGLAAQIAPTAVVPETAGAAVAGEMKSAITGLRKDADAAYAKFRTAAEDPKNAVSMPIGSPQEVSTGILDASGKPVTQTIQATDNIAMPVDMRGIKQQLEPLYVEMKQWMPISSRNSSEGFAAIEGILKGPDFMPAHIAEKGLSGLKAMAREADSPDLRNTSQGIGAHAAGQLQKAIDAAALRAGPDVLDALQKGRSAFESKMAAADVLDKMRTEPVQLFNQATYSQDAGINQLREAAKLAPGEMPKIGRAYIEKLLDDATKEGGFDKAKGLFNQWSNLGPETKKILFRNPSLVANLDQFFRVGKLLAEQPNPSMTAVVSHGLAQGQLVFYNPAVGVPYAIGSAALAKLLYSPEFVRAVTQGMKVPLKGPGAALAANQILKLAGNDAQPVDQSAVQN